MVIYTRSATLNMVFWYLSIISFILLYFTHMCIYKMSNQDRIYIVWSEGRVDIKIIYVKFASKNVSKSWKTKTNKSAKRFIFQNIQVRIYLLNFVYSILYSLGDLLPTISPGDSSLTINAGSTCTKLV